jgi:hypothetical protein
LSPTVMRLVFTTEKGARMFLDALTVEVGKCTLTVTHDLNILPSLRSIIRI